MNVITCNRKDCESEMCNKHSDEYGYLCWECYQELEHSKDLTIKEFISLPKGAMMNDYEHWVRDLNMLFEDI